MIIHFRNGKAVFIHWWGFINLGKEKQFKYNTFYHLLLSSSGHQSLFGLFPQFVFNGFISSSSHDCGNKQQ
jgi:hypothetical protein